MRDIVLIEDTFDLGIDLSVVPRAKNLLSTQIGSLEYLQSFGIDISFFLNESFKFQNESFKAYIVQALADRGINVIEFLDVFHQLYGEFKINLSPSENEDGFMAR